MGTTELVLTTLLTGPRHGYDIKRLHDEWFPLAAPLAYGQVYATLSRLEKDGSVQVVQTITDGGPERTVYAITDRGRERAQAWLTATVAPPSPGSDDLVRKTVAALRCAEDPTPLLAAQRREHLAHLRSLREARPRQGEDPLVALAREHAAAHLDAELRWLDQALALVGAATTDTVRGTA
ncbi:MAG: PadR family transcriptional regulator [Kineosporiaceae bacterium]